MPTSIAIIGSGPTAIYTAKYLLASENDLAITIFEAQGEAGKGTPYHQDWNEKEMLANIASIEIPPVTQTLVSWLQAQPDDALADRGIARADIDERSFYPRVALGDYFQAQLACLTEQAISYDHSITTLTGHKVLDVMMAENGVRLLVHRAGHAFFETVFDYVVMATGHVWPADTEIKPGYFLSPWPAAALRTIPDCRVGIRGTSLSAIDASVALSVARGSFERDGQGKLTYLPEPGTENFRITMMSRKGILPEADFFHPIPYLPLSICTDAAVDELIASNHPQLLDALFLLFKAELITCDRNYADSINLADLTLEEFAQTYFAQREQHDTFVWAARNLAEAQANQESEITVPWRYAILRMHEVIARAVPHLLGEDNQRFNRSFKHIFVDDYATVPHESIERMLALHHAGKLEVLRIGDDYMLDTQSTERGALLTYSDGQIHFPAFIEAMGQRPLSVKDFPFQGLWKQGLLENASVPTFARKKPVYIGGISLDATYHPVSGSPYASRLYCLSLPFMLGQFPFAQGITSSHDMGKTVAADIAQQIATNQIMPIVEVQKQTSYA